MFLLDTNVVSELRRPTHADASVLAWSRSVAAADLYLSAITVLEIEQGALMALRRDATKGKMFLGWLHDQILPAFKDRILPIDSVVALCCAKLHVPDPKSERDALIAATAIAHGMRVVTRNVADFEPMSVELLNPWT
jgi:predicted nucleic acid-binding protein